MCNCSVLLQNTKTAQNDAYVLYSLSCQNVSTQDSWHYSGFSPEFLISTNIKREEYGDILVANCYVRISIPAISS
jgi:hypothetical protein